MNKLFVATLLFSLSVLFASCLQHYSVVILPESDFYNDAALYRVDCEAKIIYLDEATADKETAIQDAIEACKN